MVKKWQLEHASLHLRHNTSAMDASVLAQRRFDSVAALTFEMLYSIDSRRVIVRQTLRFDD